MAKRIAEVKHFSNGKPSSTLSVEYAGPFVTESGAVAPASLFISLRNAENVSVSMKLSIQEVAHLFKLLEHAVEMGVAEEIALREGKSWEREGAVRSQQAGLQR